MDAANRRRRVAAWAWVVAGLASLAALLAVLVLALHERNIERAHEADRIEQANDIRRELCRRHADTVEMFRLFLVEGSKRFQLRPVSPEETEQIRDFERDTARRLDRIDCDPDEVVVPVPD